MIKPANNKIKDVSLKIAAQSNPVSICLYGSRATGDYFDDSDYEIGVIYRTVDEQTRESLLNITVDPAIKPFIIIYEELLQGRVRTIFNNNILLRELFGSKIIYGKNIFRKMVPPEITVSDIMTDIQFCLGKAACALLSDRANDKKSSMSYFYKSCLYGTRLLLILEKRVFASGYSDIYHKSRQLHLGKYQELIQKAYNVRCRRKEYSQKDLQLNLDYLSQRVARKITDYYHKQGDVTLIK